MYHWDWDQILDMPVIKMYQAFDWAMHFLEVENYKFKLNYERSI